MGCGHVEGDAVPAHAAALLVPPEPAVPHPVAEEARVDAVGVVAVVSVVRTLLVIVDLQHLREHRDKLRAKTLLIPVEPEHATCQQAVTDSI